MATNRGEQQAQAIVWDTEGQLELTSRREGHIRTNVMYVTALLWADMQAAFGGVVSHIKTSTDKASGEVTVARAEAGEPGAVLVRLVGSLNSAEFSFFRPLRKLGLKVPPNRQFNVTPTIKEIAGVGKVFVFPMAQRQSLPRNRREGSVAEERSGVGPD